MPLKASAQQSKEKKNTDNDNNPGGNIMAVAKKAKAKNESNKSEIKCRKSQASQREKEEKIRRIKLLSAFMIIARTTSHLSTPAMKNPLFPSVSPRNFNTYSPALRLSACSMPEWVMLRFYQTVCAICITNIRRCRTSLLPRKSAWKMCALGWIK